MDELKTSKINISAEGWDNANNLSQKTIIFNLSDYKNIKITNLFNHPNPFLNNTNFGFEINEESTITIKIFSISGEQINTLDPFDTFYGYSIIPWNGKDYYGNEIANGIYLYEIKATGIISEKVISEIGKIAKYR